MEKVPLLNKLKEYRSDLGINQTEMGKLAGVSRQTIGDTGTEAGKDLQGNSRRYI